MSAMWISEPRPLPESGPAWPGDNERMTYRGLAVQPEADLEMWDAFHDRWEVSKADTDTVLLTIYADQDLAMTIATRLAESRDWSEWEIGGAWASLALDPAVLGLMADYPGMTGLPVGDANDNLDDLVPYGPEPPAEGDPEQGWSFF